MAYIGSEFALPENPIIRAYEDCGGLGAMNGLGAFMPYNPGWKAANFRPGGMQPPPSNANLGIVPQGGLGLQSLGDCGCGCHGHGGAGSCQDDSLGSGLNGLGDFSIDETLSSVSSMLDSPSPILGIPWMYVLGGAALAFFLMSPVDASEYRYEKSKARRAYKQKLSSLGKEYPSRGRHAVQHVAAGGRALKSLF